MAEVDRMHAFVMHFHSSRFHEIVSIGMAVAQHFKQSHTIAV